MNNVNGLLEWTLLMLNDSNIKHELHSFSSGVYMLDIWHENNFYVLQFESNYIGFSKIGDDNPFTTEPDRKLYSDSEFLHLMNSIIQ